MKIDIQKLSEGRELVLFEKWDAKAYDLNAPGWLYDGPLEVEVLAVRDSGIVKVRVSLNATVALTCSRCLKDFKTALEKSFNLAYPIDLSEKVILLDDNIREELILSYPQKIFCRKDCKGLCIKCGADLNEEKCEHPNTKVSNI